MESLALEAGTRVCRQAIEFHFEPEHSLQIQGPHITQICVVGFATADDHVFAEEATRMVGPRLGQLLRAILAALADLRHTGDGLITLIMIYILIWKLFSRLFWQSQLQGVIESQSLRLTASKDIDPIARKISLISN